MKGVKISFGVVFFNSFGSAVVHFTHILLVLFFSYSSFKFAILQTVQKNYYSGR